MTARMIPLHYPATCEAPGCIRAPSHVVWDNHASLGKFCEFHADAKVRLLNEYRTMVDRVSAGSREDSAP